MNANPVGVIWSPHPPTSSTQLVRSVPELVPNASQYTEDGPQVPSAADQHCSVARTSSHSDGRSPVIPTSDVWCIHPIGGAKNLP